MSAKTLILGWGNPGRGDDGLGPEFVRLIARLQIPTVVVDADYQLQIEDAAEIAGFQRVVFVDADRTGVEPFWLARLHPDGSPSFSTHSVAPGAILSLTRDLFQIEPEAWVLGIRGYQFDEFGESLSVRARSNLDRAVEYMKAALVEADLAEVGADSAGMENTRGHVGETCQTTSP